MDSENNLIEQRLKERIRVLEKENSYLMDQSENTLLLGNISEIIEKSKNIKDMLNDSLERISIFKMVPFVACCSIANNKLNIIKSYLSFLDKNLNGLSFELKSNSNDSQKVLNSLLKNNDISYEINQLILIPFSTQSIESGFMLFASCDKNNYLSNIEPILKRVVELLTISIDNRELLNNYKSLNKDLDLRVKERSHDLKESEQKYRALIEGSDAAIMLFARGKFQDCNQATLKIFGYNDKEKFLKLEPWVVSPHKQKNGEDSAELAKSYLQQTMETGVCRFNWIHKRENGECFPAYVHLSRVKIKNEVMVQGIVIDHSKRSSEENAFKAVIESIVGNFGKSFFENITRKISDWLNVEYVFISEIVEDKKVTTLAKNIDGKILSNYSYKLSGTPCEVTFNDNFCYYSKNVTTLFPKDIDLVSLKAESYLGVVLKDCNNRSIGLISIISRKELLLPERAREVLEVIAVITAAEITRNYESGQLQLMEKKFNQSQKMEAIGTLVGGIAHDFNNILTGMVGSIYLVKRKVKHDADLFKLMTSMEKQSFRAASMISQLLAFARKGSMKIREINFSHLVKESLEFVRRTIPENIILNSTYCKKSLYINGDSGLLQQIIINLVNNSKDALNKSLKPKIWVSIELVSASSNDPLIKDSTFNQNLRYAKLVVKDNGCGICETDLKKIFEPFFTTKSVGKGTGLGLSMVYGTVQSHNGFIDVQSDLNVGTTSSIFIPIIEEKSNNLYSTIKRNDVEKGNGETILFVDDDEDLREVSVILIEKLGYNVLIAKDGVEALDLFKANQEKIKLVISDVIMPKMGGVDLVNAIWEKYSPIPFIFISGYDNNELNNLPKDNEKIKLLSKPFSIEVLGEEILNSISS